MCRLVQAGLWFRKKAAKTINNADRTFLMSVQYSQMQTLSWGYQMGLECTKNHCVYFTFIPLSHTRCILVFVLNSECVVAQGWSIHNEPAGSSHSPLVPSSFLPLQLDSPWQLNQAQTRRPSRRRTRRRRRRYRKQLIIRRLRTSQRSFLWPPDTAPLSGRNRSDPSACCWHPRRKWNRISPPIWLAAFLFDEIFSSCLFFKHLHKTLLNVNFLVYKLCLSLCSRPACARTLHTIHAQVNCAFVWKMEMTKHREAHCPWRWLASHKIIPNQFFMLLYCKCVETTLLNLNFTVDDFSVLRNVSRLHSQR